METSRKRRKDNRTIHSKGITKYMKRGGWNKGLKMPDTFCKQRSIINKKLGIIPPSRKGIKHSKETKKKMSKSHIGKHTFKRSIETCQKMSIARMGISPWNKGKRGCYSKEWIKKMSELHKGDKSFFWQGGISYEPYGKDWTNSLKRSIRERDNYVCRMCSDIQNEITFVVHHIDYDKKNNNPTNLITLCRKCHNKTNTRRENWKKYFKQIIWEGKIEDIK